MIQLALRTWPAEAVHDTVRAVMRTAPFQRSLRTSLLERLLSWLGQGFRWLAREVDGMPSARTVVIWVVVLLAAALVARLLLAARARDVRVTARGAGGGQWRGEDPWLAADRLAGEGDLEGAAHALYRGVLASLAASERVRLDPARTSGDYARELRARGSGAWQPFRAFSRHFDAAVYGHGRIDAGQLAELRRLALPLRASARAA